MGVVVDVGEEEEALVESGMMTEKVLVMTDKATEGEEEEAVRNS